MKMNKVYSLLLASVIIVAAPVYAQESGTNATAPMDMSNKMDMGKKMDMGQGNKGNGMDAMKNMHQDGNMDPAAMKKMMDSHNHQPMKSEAKPVTSEGKPEDHKH